ncbi:hypothetical protein F8M41_021936 [Gigaspora margarita]|uniref:Uncharacterized protein n=1 Tax=Gigaspora margarita TaxID=4874 RepID=A0A8H4EIE8_GIGMA|nr:hypothetical protein F8M41_021936 [Gigaspora margarita]
MDKQMSIQSLIILLHSRSTDNARYDYLKGLIPESSESEEKVAVRTYFTKNDYLVTLAIAALRASSTEMIMMSSANAALRSCSTKEEKCGYLKRLILNQKLKYWKKQQNAAARIPTVKKRPMFILHSLPDFDNDQLITKGYIQEEKLLELRNKVLDKSWFFLIGTSGSGKTRSLFELFCHMYGICFTINAENGIKMNLGSKDLDIVINELENYLTNYHENNNRVALRFTLIKLLELHSNDGNFTPKKWLLIQLLPCGKDYWDSIFYVFRELKEEDQNKLITNFTERFKSLIPKQEKLPIAIDESQAAIKKFEGKFSSSLVGRPLRLLFSILLRTVIDLSAGNLCLILSGTGMAFDDIKFYTQSAISNQIVSTFNIFQGRRRFLVQFLEHAILNTSSKSHSNIDNAVRSWQDSAKKFIILTFKNTCFYFLLKKKVVWNKVRDITIISMFSRWSKHVRGDGVAEMVQYGFAQLDSIDGPTDLSIFEKDAITVRIAESFPILAFIEYVREKPKDLPGEIEKQFLQNLCSVFSNASCAGYLFEPYLTIPLAKLFNGKSCKSHPLFANISNINKLDLLSYNATIRNLNDDSTKLCSNDDINTFNLVDFLNNPTTAFFMPDRHAGPDLVCIVQFHFPNGIIEVPLFLQAKLVKDTPPNDAKYTTDPHHFYLSRN